MTSYQIGDKMVSTTGKHLVEQIKEDETMKRRRTYIWAYLDGKKLVEVIQAALDNNMMVDDMKQLLIKENPNHEVTFKVTH